MDRLRAFVALGSDATDAPERLSRALAAVEGRGIHVAAVSRAAWCPFEDPAGAVGEDRGRVLDAVAELRAPGGWDAEQLFGALQQIEVEAGRRRGAAAQRTLDLDLLDTGDIRTQGHIVLPHPRALGRAFVLAPWEEIASLHEITGTGASVTAHAQALRRTRKEAFARLRWTSNPSLPDRQGAPLVLEDGAALAAWRASVGAASVGVVPTMGALHPGHESLLRRARAECEAVVATLFVNPLQFGPGEDLARYPRTFDADLAVLARAGVDAVYAPAPRDLYPSDYATYLEPEGPALGLEGAERPGHFRGVATVVYKLWRRTQPDRAYFGRKDAQQLAVIRRLVLDLELNGTVVPCPTLRGIDGLALSSRNRYLSSTERERACGLSRALEMMAFSAADGADVGMLLAMGQRALQEAELDVDYLRIVDADTMADSTTLSRPQLAVAVVRAGSTRLLDNRWLVDPAGVQCV